MLHGTEIAPDSFCLNFVYNFVYMGGGGGGGGGGEDLCCSASIVFMGKA